MTGWALLCVAAAVAATATGLAPHPRQARVVTRPRGPGWQPVGVIGAGVAAWLVVGGVAGAGLGVVVALGCRRLLAGAESAAERRARLDAERALPHLVDLFAATLHGGADPVAGLARVCAALPGPAADRLLPVVEQARWGADRTLAWSTVADDPVLAGLARTMVRSEQSGASVVRAVERLADELAREARARAEDAARQVGVSAAVPLGLCLLPAFLLLGVVPTVAALFSDLTP